jgi:hypothetical protein
MLLDCRQSLRTIAPRSGEYDAYCILTLVLGEREHESIDRSAVLTGGRGFGDAQATFSDGESGIWRDDVDMIGENSRAVGRLRHIHCRAVPDELGQDACVVGGKMLDQHERHPGVGRHVAKKVRNASNPPTEAPMPTIRQDADCSASGRASFERGSARLAEGL